jgi:aspartyl-tRNA(Asn)/glutamyl-tRNA(Gln) amidotransferase subunit B
LEKQFGLTAYDADVLVNQGRALVNYYLELAERTGDGKVASNWLQQDVMRALKDEGLEIDRFPISAAALAELLLAVKEGKLSTSRAREVFAGMFKSGRSAADEMQAQGIEQVDESALVALCQELLDANPKIVADLKAGKQQAVGALVGQAKKKNPNANPGRVREICVELAAKM